MAEARALLHEQRIKLAGLDLPADLDSKKREEVEQTINASFVSGFRVIMFMAAALALAGALSTWLTIETKKP